MVAEQRSVRRPSVVASNISSVPHENPCRAFRRLRREPRFAMRLCQVCRVPDDRANGLAYQRRYAPPAPASAAHCVYPCPRHRRSEEHTSELQSLMRISYAVFCLNKTKYTYTIYTSSNKN